MRAFSVPTIAGAVVAAFSLIYFSAASHWVGDEALSLFVVAMAEVALIQAVLIPRTWLHVISGTHAESDTRIANAMVIELLGGVIGGVVLLATCLLRGLDTDASTLRAVVYVSLWVPSLTSATGAYRIQHRWIAYFFWIAGSALLRFPVLALVSPFIDRANATPAHNIVFAVGVSYLGPELLRFALYYLPLARRYLRRPSGDALLATLREVSANWRFDLGSSITDSLDKIIVGAWFGPQILVAYFFARRIAGAIPMVLEPFYAHVYQQRTESLRSTVESSFLWSSYGRGLAISLAIAITASGVFVLASVLPATAALLPPALAAHMVLFVGILLLDAVFCANRWYRYVSQHRGATLLFAIRIVSFLAFFGIASHDIDVLSPTTPLTALACALLIDTLALIYLTTVTRLSVAPASTTSP